MHQKLGHTLGFESPQSFYLFFIMKLTYTEIVKIEEQIEQIKKKLKEAAPEERKAIILELKKTETLIDELKHTFNV